MQLHGISYEGRFRDPPRLLPPMRRIALCPTRPSLDLDSQSWLGKFGQHG